MERITNNTGILKTYLLDIIGLTGAGVTMLIANLSTALGAMQELVTFLAAVGGLVVVCLVVRHRMLAIHKERLEIELLSLKVKNLKDDE